MRKIFDKLFKKSVRKFIPQIQPWIDNEELIQLKRVISSTYVTESSLTKEFEDSTKSLTGSKHAIAYTNGTLAMYASLRALGVGKGDEVIIPNLTFIATANCVIMTGAKPVLCEVRKDNFTLDVKKAGKLLTKNTKAIIPVHLYGQSADMDEILYFAKTNNLKILEDAAQGVGVRFNGKHTGTFGEVGVLSYYGNKTITCGEGGIILTNDDEIASKVYQLKNHGRSTKGIFIHESIGFNFAFTEMQAAIGIAQMNKLSRIIEKKNSIYELYKKELSGIDDFKICFLDKRSTPVFWFTSFECKEVDELANFLKLSKIQTRRYFYPLHLQPCYADKKHIKNIDDDFSISEKIYKNGISLPSSYNLSVENQLIVISKIKEFYENRD